MDNKQKAINGGKWVTISTVTNTLLQFLQIAILARLLDPLAFGVVSISTLIINFFNIFANLGFSNSIIHKQESDRNILSTLYGLNIGLGIIIFLLINACSFLIVDFYDEPRLYRVLRVSSFYFLIVYVGQIYSILLQKELLFKPVAIIEILAVLAGTSVTITLAYLGFEELSLIYGQLTMQAVKSVLQIMYGKKFFLPTLHFDLKKVKDHLMFGIYNVGDGLFNFFQSNLDTIAIGGVLGVKMLGYYTIAYQLAIFPITRLNPIVLQVAYPVIAKMKTNTQELKRSYLKILDLVSYVNFPLLAGLYITAESIVPLVYGPGWEPTIHLIKIFVFVSAFSCLSHPLFTLAYTKGKPNLLFFLNLATLLVKMPLVYFLGVYYGVTGVAVAFLLATFLNFVLNFAIVHHLIGSFLKEFFKIIIKPITYCFLLIMMVFLYKSLIGYQGLVNTIAEITIGGLVYIGLTLSFKMSLQELKALKKMV
ncbi:MOP flippase family protein [Rufibacter glacialis]|uniref:MOP flippase family protein n=1 Tax=Rufibacter glacialis TaxID=1259555 RepID=A0A5M8QNF8_9BACT|nr:MOP flippase family protein [Rufibacter glacialis]KAA6437747.1 MOP flippase family protein [Rufibacter glacialis]GGK56648.1 lipopolysaccharide biosynthesis protein [Rufibacter glacialis]